MVVLPIPSNRSINKRKCSSLSHGYGIMITSRSKHGASTRSGLEQTIPSSLFRGSDFVAL